MILVFYKIFWGSSVVFSVTKNKEGSMDEIISSQTQKCISYHINRRIANGIGKIRINNLMLLKNEYCSMSYNNLYPSNCNTIFIWNKCDSEIWFYTMIVSKSFQMIAKQIQFWYGLQHFQKLKLWKAFRTWGLQNAFAPGFTLKSATLSCILNACTIIWIVAHFLHHLPNLKSNNN